MIAKSKKKQSTVAEELALVRGRKRMLTAEAVVKWASNHPDSALYGRFTWDKDDAAHKWNLHQARNLIRVNVKVLQANTEPVKTYVSLKADRKNNTGYRVMVDVLNDPDLRATMLAEALDELQAFECKYKAISELAPVFEAIRTVRRKKVT